MLKVLIVAFAVVVSLLLFPLSASADECSPEQQLTGGCTVAGTVDDEEVVLKGEHTVPGAPGTGPGVFRPERPD